MNWYLLFDGSSPDGRGTANYIGRTLSRQEAKRFLKKNSDNPYWTGYVLIVTDTTAYRMK